MTNSFQYDENGRSLAKGSNPFAPSLVNSSQAEIAAQKVRG